MAKAAAADGPSMKLQIVVDKKNNKVMFAEAKKNFVDFIFHIMSLPLVTFQRIIADTSPTSLGSIGALYVGFKNLENEYMEITAKYYIMNQLKALYRGKNTTLLLPEATHSDTRKIYQCSEDETVRVEMHCSHLLYSSCLSELKFGGLKRDVAALRGNEEGYVKEVAKYMVMDNLVVRPAEPSSVISMMNQLSINDVRDVEKREVTFGTDEAIKLLKASVSSTTVLTDVFLRGAVKTEN